jgi:2-dehydro-3-deoxygluconokinase
LLNLKPKSECRWDIVSIGEVMLRFDPGDERIRTTRSFRVYEGGGEYNVARNLASCFRLDAVIVTALADNEVGRLVEGLIAEGRVDISQIVWRQTDGISRGVRNGMYFWERGFGLRSPKGCSDRGNTAVSQLQSGDIDWQKIFNEHGGRWFHTGGIFAGLSESTAEVAAEAMRAARESGSIVSYDLNYRDSLWSARGGRDAANEVNRRLLDLADVVFGVEGFDSALANYNEAKFEAAAKSMLERHQNIRIIATPLRTIYDASRHDLSSVCFADGKVFRGPTFENVRVLDRVGSGDAFAAGAIYELLTGRDARAAINTASAAALLAMTMPGDSLTATAGEIKGLSDRSNDSLSR